MARINKKNLELEAAERKFNLILVSHDDTREGVADYLKESALGCAAVKAPIGELEYGEPITNLVTKGYRGSIPTLVLLDREGSLVSASLREVLLRANRLSRGKSQRVKDREARAAAKRERAEPAGEAPGE